MRYDVYGIGAALVDTEIEVSDQDLAELGITKGHMTLVDMDRQQQLEQYLSTHMTFSRRASGAVQQTPSSQPVILVQKRFIPAKWPPMKTVISTLAT